MELYFLTRFQNAITWDILGTIFFHFVKKFLVADILLYQKQFKKFKSTSDSQALKGIRVQGQLKDGHLNNGGA